MKKALALLLACAVALPAFANDASSPEAKPKVTKHHMVHKTHKAHKAHKAKTKHHKNAPMKKAMASDAQ